MTEKGEEDRFQIEKDSDYWKDLKKGFSLNERNQIERKVSG